MLRCRLQITLNLISAVAVAQGSHGHLKYFHLSLRTILFEKDWKQFSRTSEWSPTGAGCTTSTGRSHRSSFRWSRSMLTSPVTSSSSGATFSLLIFEMGQEEVLYLFMITLQFFRFFIFRWTRTCGFKITILSDFYKWWPCLHSAHSYTNTIFTSILKCWIIDSWTGTTLNSWSPSSTTGSPTTWSASSTMGRPTQCSDTSATRMGRGRNHTSKTLRFPKITFIVSSIWLAVNLLWPVTVAVGCSKHRQCSNYLQQPRSL